MDFTQRIETDLSYEEAIERVTATSADSDRRPTIWPEQGQAGL